LLFPDLPAWESADGYSPEVAKVLSNAYRHLRHISARLDTFANVYQLVIGHIDHLMSARQRMHASYLLGSACMAIGEPALALDYLGEALEIATLGLEDAKASAVLAYLHGIAHSWLLQYREAADDLCDVLDIVRALAEESSPKTSAFELTVLGNLAGFEFIVTEYEKSMQHLREATPLLRQRKDHMLGVGTIEWIWALIYRWRGKTSEALHRALVASEYYASGDAPASLGRIETIVAEIALDQAEFFGRGDSHSAFLTIAGPYVHRGLALARESHDAMGECLALLTQARLSRVAKRNEDRIPDLERIIKTARRAGDGALLASSMTELGHELILRSETSSALRCYHKAVLLAETCGTPAMGRYAERALLLHQES
jgi:tetratricopeptide (TPR) repeat protein